MSIHSAPSEVGRFIVDPAFLDGDSSRLLQDRCVARQAHYAATRSPYYSRLFAGAGIDPRDIQRAADLSALPLTSKDDLSAHNDDFLAVDPARVVDVCLSSGTSGAPVRIEQTQSDLHRLALNEARAFQGAGFSAADTVLLCCTIDRCFMAGLAYFLGLSRLGARVVRAGAGSPRAQWELIDRLRPTALVGVPSLMRDLARAGRDPRAAGIARIVCIGEPLRDERFDLTPVGRDLAELWGARLFGTYASTEMATAFCECEAGRGGHLLPDLIHVETLDAEGRPTAVGEPGEVVATPLGIEGMPLLRFRTGDLATLHTAPCACGRETPRLGPVIGRLAQMMKIQGTTVYPPAIFEAAQAIPGAGRCLIEVRAESPLSDLVTVVVAAVDPMLSEMAVSDVLQARLRVRPSVRLDKPEVVERQAWAHGGRKPQTFFDFR